MKKIVIILSAIVAGGWMLVSCNDVKRTPGRIYMPDMAYSRAVETYASTQELKDAGIYYDALPVAGTVKRGGEMPYHLKNDSMGYVQSALVKSPIAPPDTLQLVEAQRLYNINCGICHGTKLDGNGPLYNGGKGPYPAAPKNFMADDMKKMAEGTMFHSVTYGKNKMGSYASQLTTRQRWMIIAFIKKKQAEAGGATATTAPAADTMKTAVKK
jgi:mono/diheme cytochrome c family protein